MPLSPGQILHQRYQIQSILGRGGMGVVYQAYDTVLQRAVAVKVLPPQLTIDPEFVTRFQREAIASANLRHAHIVTVHDVGQQDGEYFIIMEYLEGDTLEQWLASHGPMPVAQADRVIEQIAAALDHAHGRGIVHRDVKPSNIMLDSHNRAVLMDFGLVRAGEGLGPTRSTTVMGTPEYMAPEQVLGQAIDRRTDIYALGVVMFEMLSGRTPFAHTTPLATAHAHAYEAPPPLRSVNKAVSVPVEAVVMKALAKDPAARYQSAGELARDFTQAVSGVMPAGLAASSSSAGSRRRPAASPAAGVKTVAMPSPSGGTPLAPARPAGSEKAGALVAAGILAMVAILLGVVLWPRTGAVGDSPTPTLPAVIVAATVTDTPTQPARRVLPTDAPAVEPSIAVVEPITPTASAATAAPTLTPSPLPTRSPTATPVPVDTPTATATRTPTPTATRSNTSTPTSTARPNNTNTPTATPRPANTNTPTPPVVSGAPVLTAPAESATVSGVTTFSWQWSGPALAPNQAFEVRLWKEGQSDHYGAAAPTRSPNLTIDVNGAYGVQQGGGGWYAWTVALVEIEPYRRIGQEAPPRAIFVIVDGGGGDTSGATPTWTPPPPSEAF